MLCQNPSCNALLAPNAKFCSQCGYSIPDVATQSQPNKYIRDVAGEGKNYKEHTEFSISDNAVNALAPLIVEQIFARQPQHMRQPAKQKETVVLPETRAITGDLFDQNEPIVEEQNQNPEQSWEKELSNGAAHHFRKDGEYLLAVSQGYKGKDWKEQQCRFILMYASAYEEHFKQPVPNRKHFADAAQKAKVYDKNNFSRYLSGFIGGKLSEASTGIFINPAGQSEVKQILSEMEDPKIPLGEPYWNRSASDKSERHYLDADTKERIKQWAQEEVNLGAIQLHNIASCRDYAILALGILTLDLKKADAVMWNEAYHFLKEKWAISAKPDAFSRTFDRKGNAGVFRKTDKGYILQQQGIDIFEGWRNGKPIQAHNDERDE